MKDGRQILLMEVSRRSMLQGAAYAAGAAAILGTSISAANAAKMPQSAVAYQSSPNGGKNCSGCKLFVAPSSCKSVDGAISPNGWCRIYVPKA